MKRSIIPNKNACQVTKAFVKLILAISRFAMQSEVRKTGPQTVPILLSQKKSGRASSLPQVVDIDGAPGMIRTCDPLIRSASQSTASGYGSYDLLTFVTGCSRHESICYQLLLLLSLWCCHKIVATSLCSRRSIHDNTKTMEAARALSCGRLIVTPPNGTPRRVAAQPVF